MPRRDWARTPLSCRWPTEHQAAAVESSVQPSPCPELERWVTLWQKPGAQNPCHSASCAAIASEIEWKTTPTDTSGRMQKRAKSDARKEPKELHLKTGMRCCESTWTAILPWDLLEIGEVLWTTEGSWARLPRSRINHRLSESKPNCHTRPQLGINSFSRSCAPLGIASHGTRRNPRPADVHVTTQQQSALPRQDASTVLRGRSRPSLQSTLLCLRMRQWATERSEGQRGGMVTY